ncbi:GNAT family N-acetyltransferase [Shinella sp. BYT-45]|uniref:GNAT family N-acetyltransferase n=1 Tax=Shinella sp. BYT-45 TaxID=3377377 RepID=UPI003980E1CB
MIAVRNAREEDVPALVEIGVRAWELAVFGVADLQVRSDHARNAFEQFLAGHWLRVSVAECDGVLAGWASREALDDEISDLWIDPPHQRRGIGSALLAAMEAEVVAAGFEAARLQTHARNIVAVGFFQKHGYAVNWLSVDYSPRLDRDVESVGLRRQLVADEPAGYGPDGF